MNRGVYRSGQGRERGIAKKRLFIGAMAVIALAVVGVAGFKILAPSSVEKAISQLQFDDTVIESEKQAIRQAIEDQSKTYNGSLTVSVATTLEQPETSSVLTAYVPVTHVYASRQQITRAELAQLNVYVPANLDDKVKSALAEALGITATRLIDLTSSVEAVRETEIAFIPAQDLSPQVKLLQFEDAYYLDSFQKGGVFRAAVFSGDDSDNMAGMHFSSLASKESTLRVNMTGVTALTRVMMKKLATVKDPLYFSERIGDFLADADITHVSNEVSFRTGCQYSNTLFCSPPEFIETLKDSGVDLVELTGNHNNDNGSTYNSDSINLYHSLGMSTFGGGLNAAEAAKPYVAEQKGSKVTFIGYNMADGAGSGAIAGPTTAGANIYTESKAKADIEAAKQTSQFVIVNIQYAECQAYPAGYVEFPECDGTIGGQEEAFRKMIDLGADMVIGSSAHQPQTYEMYKGKPIYYGLGNLYFEQTQWPGTERGIILTHYFAYGKLIQTKLSPTVYDRDFQTRLMDNEDAVILLDRLNKARPAATN